MVIIVPTALNATNCAEQHAHHVRHTSQSQASRTTLVAWRAALLRVTLRTMHGARCVHLTWRDAQTQTRRTAQREVTARHGLRNVRCARRAAPRDPHRTGGSTLRAA